TQSVKITSRHQIKAALPQTSNTLIEDTHPGGERVLDILLTFCSAVFYAGSSFLITVVNKTVLTSFRFPSYLCLGIGQMITTVVVLYVAKKSKTVQFQDFDKSIPFKIFPLPLLYVGNHVTGLASTKKLSLPMFTVLRKFTILMTMILEVYVLRKTFPKRLVYSVVAIVFGAMVAASSDLAFDVEAYTFILLNDAFTATNSVYMKKKLGTEGLGKYGVLFYNSMIIVIPTLLASAFTGDLHKVHTATNLLLFSLLLTFTLPGEIFVLMYSIVLCSYYNSALTTAVVGAIKNVAVAYIGIFVGGDYLFSWTNFIGLSICMSGGLVYSYFTFKSKALGDNSERTRELKIRITEESTERVCPS
uniref:UDP-N-acetylglucosamine/UDP-glucose/GDP-mannose transporter-like n=1 Tax=Echeneis naucrates TaxID=173247 RepID=A0A665THN9_ECHNA